MAEAPAHTLPVQPGQIIAGKYRVEGLLGQGSMGVVVAASPVGGGAQVAIKLMLPDALEQTEALARFQREVSLVSQLQSPHVARVIDSGSHDDGSPFMAIEYLDGHDLSRELELHGPLPIAQAVDWVLQALEALSEAHSHGIIHRDLKPQNLFIARQPDGTRALKILDFGISKQRADGVSAISLTKTHALIGSPLYMSPEQVLAAKDVDLRTDLWSIGVVLHELLLGTTPFDGPNVGTVLGNVLSAPIPVMTERRPDIPRPLARVLERCLERTVTRRHPSGVALARALAPFASPASQATLERIERFAPLFPDNEPLANLNTSDIGNRTTLPGPDSLAISATLPPADFSPSSLPTPSALATVRPRSLRGPIVAILIVLLLLGGAVAAARWSAAQP